MLLILIGATVFSFTFNAAEGHLWIEHLFTNMPGGQLGFLLIVNLLVFGLGCFIDFFEIAFIVVPLLAPVAAKLDIDLVWFGVILAINLQTSFLTPPFGFALFYLRNVAPRSDCVDRVTKKSVRAVSTPDIYRGSIVFIILQIAMVAAVIAFPGLVTDSLEQGKKVNTDTIRIEPPPALEAPTDPLKGLATPPAESPTDQLKGLAPPPPAESPDDLLKRLAPPPAPPPAEDPAKKE